MAIARTQQDNITDIELEQKDALEGKKTDKKASEKPETIKLEKKPGFFTSTINELKKVEWPGLRYVVNWSLAILLFTAVLSLFLGFADHIFSAGISFANCTSPANSDSRTVQECSDELVTKLTFRD